MGTCNVHEKIELKKMKSLKSDYVVGKKDFDYYIHRVMF